MTLTIVESRYEFASSEGFKADIPMPMIILPVVQHKVVAEVSKMGNQQERLVVVTHGWQSESTDGPKGGWSCVFWSGCSGCSGHVTTTAGCSVV